MRSAMTAARAETIRKRSILERVCNIMGWAEFGYCAVDCFELRWFRARGKPNRRDRAGRRHRPAKACSKRKKAQATAPLQRHFVGRSGTHVRLRHRHDAKAVRPSGRKGLSNRR